MGSLKEEEKNSDDTHGGVIIVNSNRYSTEDSNISCTPEGENYFKRQTEALFKKVNEGDIDDLDIEVPAHVAYGIQPSESGSDLVVKPVTFATESEVEIMNLNFQPTG